MLREDFKDNLNEKTNEVTVHYCGNCPLRQEKCPISQDDISCYNSEFEAKRYPNCPLDEMGGKLTFVLDKTIFPSIDEVEDESEMLQKAEEEALLAGIQSRR